MKFFTGHYIHFYGSYYVRGTGVIVTSDVTTIHCSNWQFVGLVIGNIGLDTVIGVLESELSITVTIRVEQSVEIFSSRPTEIIPPFHLEMYV